MVLRIHTSGLEDLMASSDGIAIQYRLIYRLINSVNPIRMNSSADTEVHGPGQDSVIPIRPTVVNAKALTWPKRWVLEYSTQPSVVELNPNRGIQIQELDNEVEVTLPTPRNSVSLERNKEIQPIISRKNILETDDTASDAGSSNSRKIVGYKSVQIPVYEDETPSTKMMMSHEMHCHAIVQGTIDTCIRAKLCFPEYEEYTLDSL